MQENIQYLTKLKHNFVHENYGVTRLTKVSTGQIQCLTLKNTRLLTRQRRQTSTQLNVPINDALDKRTFKSKRCDRNIAKIIYGKTEVKYVNLG